MRKAIAYLFRQACRVVCMLGLVCGLASCSWHEAKEVIVLADSLDQMEHIIYDDTAALGRAIRCLDNPFGRLLMPNTLGKAYYYMGRNLEDCYMQVIEAAKCYIEADRLQIDDPIYRGRVNSCMGYICAQNVNDSLALIFYERATEDFKESGNEWRYAQSLLNRIDCHIFLHDFEVCDTLLQIAQTYQLDSTYRARFHEKQGLFFYERQQYDSALVSLERGLEYRQSEQDRCFSYLTIMRVYLDIDYFDNALPYAQLIIENSNNSNYLVNAYYCLLLEARAQHNADLLSKYSHAREDANRLLNEKMSNYAEALPILEEHIHNPHPWCWAWIVITCFVALCSTLFIGIIVFRKKNIARLQLVCTKIDDLSTRLKMQETICETQKLQIDFEIYLNDIRTKYHFPQKQWKDYIQLKKDINPYLQDWLEELRQINLTKTERIFCIYSLIYPQLSLHELSNYMDYSYAGLRVLKSRLLKNKNISSANFYEALKIWAISCTHKQQ